MFSFVFRSCKVYIFSRSEDEGEHFEENIKIADDTLLKDKTSPHLCIDKKERIYLVWSDARNDNGDIYLTQSLDKGISFGTNILINDDTGGRPQAAFYVRQTIKVHQNGVASPFRQ